MKIPNPHAFVVMGNDYPKGIVLTNDEPTARVAVKQISEAAREYYLSHTGRTPHIYWRATEQEIVNFDTDATMAAVIALVKGETGKQISKSTAAALIMAVLRQH